MIDPKSIAILKKIEIGCHDGYIGQLLNLHKI